MKFGSTRERTLIFVSHFVHSIKIGKLETHDDFSFQKIVVFSTKISKYNPFQSSTNIYGLI